MKEFDISISGEFEKVPARVLDPPKLAYSNRATNVAKGIWRADRFFNPSTLISADNSWTILNLNRQTQDRNLYELRDSLINNGEHILAEKIRAFIDIPLKQKILFFYVK